MVDEIEISESTVRAQAKRRGFRVTKSRHPEHLNNCGGYMLVDVGSNTVVAGGRYELTLEDVSALLREDGGPWIDSR